MDVAQLIEAEQFEASVAGDEARQAAFICSLDEFVGRAARP